MGIMVSSESDGSEQIMRRLARGDRYNAAEHQLLFEKPRLTRVFAAGATVGQLQRSVFVSSGWLGRTVFFPDGRSQTLSVLIPGDLITEMRERRPLHEVSLVAISQARLADAAPLKDIVFEHSDIFPHLSRDIEQAERQETSRLLDQLIRLGSQQGTQRLASLLLELFGRCWRKGLAGKHSFPMPLSLSTLASCLGVSEVHASRLMRRFRDDGIFRLRSGVATITDLPGLMRLASEHV